MNSRKTAFFSMVEMVLALGVIAIGAVSIMALFPVGLTASRDAVGETYATDSADQFLHYFVGALRASGFTWMQFTTDPANRARPTSPEPASWKPVYAGGNLYWENALIPDPQYYKMIQKAPGASVVDFSGIYRVWYDQIILDGTPISPNVAIGVYIEVSWPAELSYSLRETALYYREVFNPN